MVCNPSDMNGVVNDQDVVPVAALAAPESTLYVTELIPDASDAVPDTAVVAVFSIWPSVGDTMDTTGGVVSTSTEPGSVIWPFAILSASPKPPSVTVSVRMLSPSLLPRRDVALVHVPPETFQY